MSPALEPLADVLLSASWKAALLVGAAMLVTGRMRHAPASARHLVWSSTLAGVLLLPLLSLAVPALPVLPALPTLAGVAAPAPEVVPAPAAAGASEAPIPALAAPVEGAAAQADAPPPAPRASHVALRALPWLWALGAAAILLRLASGVAGVWWLGRRAVMVTDGGWLHLAHDLARRLGLSRGVTLLRGDRGSVPMTWGVLQPIIWLPSSAEAWTPERRTVVLAHELAHVRRRDALTQWIAHLALVVHWFNPLVWHAVRRLREERERACDDAVLEIGTLPTAYADHLLDLVRSLGASGGPAAAMAMARRSQFEGRLLAILDGALPRGGTSRGAALATLALVLGASLPLASLRAGEPAPAPAEVAARFVATESGPPALPVDRPASAAAPADTVPAAYDPIDLVSLIEEMESDGEKATLLLHALRIQHPNPALRRDVVRAARGIGSSGDRSSVLLAVLRDPGADPEILREVLAATAGIASSGDQASVLLRIVKRLPLSDPAVRDRLFAVLSEIDSSGDRTSVLASLLERRDLPEATLEEAIRAAGRVESDGDAASLLAGAAEVHRPRIRGAVYDAFLEAARGIGSDGDRGMVLAKLLAPGARAPREPRGGVWNASTSEQVLEGTHDGVPSFDLQLSAKEVVLGEEGDAVVDVRPGGHLTVEHTRYPGNPDPDPLVPEGSRETVKRSLSVRRAGEALRFDYTVNGERRAFGEEGRAWLAQVLRRVQRY